jgi:hypothetical protein
MTLIGEGYAETVYGGSIEITSTCHVGDEC